MEPRTLLDFMGVAERLKCNMRHSRTAENRRESVAEHTYRLCVFTWLVKEEFPDCDMDKVMRMSLFHDLGEAVTGDIPAFVKTDSDREVEESAISNVTAMLPERERKELDALFDELEKAETMEAKIVHALDKMEALIQHNEADIATWLPLEYDLQMTYGEKECKADPYLAKLREVIRQISADKIASEGEERGQSYYIRKGVENMHLEEVAALLHSTDWAKDRTEGADQKSNGECHVRMDYFWSDCISEGGKDRTDRICESSDGWCDDILPDGSGHRRSVSRAGVWNNHDESDYEGKRASVWYASYTNCKSIL